MPWNKNGDTGATHPALMRVGALPGADPRSINEVAGFFWRLTNLSSAHMTDHVIDAGTVMMIAGSNADQVLKLATRSGLLTKIRDPSDKRLWAYQLLDDPEFVHIRTRAEVEWARQQKADCSNLRLAVPVRLRDGDQCRYCEVVVYFGGGRPSARKGTLDHLQPGQAGTTETMVVACMTCNSSQRAAVGEDRLPLLPPPIVPFYSRSTADWLTKNGRPVQATDGSDETVRPGIQPDPATTTPQGCDPASSRIPRPDDEGCDLASGQIPRPAATGNSDLNAISQPEEIGLGGSGRDGPGDAFPQPPTSVTRRRKRSRRAPGGAHG